MSPSKQDLKNMAYLKLWRTKKISEQQFWEILITNKKSEKKVFKYIKKLLHYMKEEGI